VALYRPDVIVASASPLFQADDVTNVNRLLEAEGLGRPLKTESQVAAGGVSVIPTTVDAAVVRDTLKKLRLRGDVTGRYGLDYQYLPGTAGQGARDGNIDYYRAAGCQTGHGEAPWLPAPAYQMPPQPDWSREKDERRPVVALLDEGVDAGHDWLPPVSEDDPFVTSWEPTEPFPKTLDTRYRGHGTFNAGIIRITAPKARVLSMRVMGSDGRVDESKVVEALTWLAEHQHSDPVDVICLPFGRHKDDDDDDLNAVEEALSRLTTVPVVASAGNDGTERPVYPAAFAADQFLRVISVGSADSGTERARYSNFGVWVKQWRGGTNMLSLMPMPDNVEPTQPRDGYAWWSGTSFAAVRYAAELANRVVS
jgi:hypothetical protein